MHHLTLASFDCQDPQRKLRYFHSMTALAWFAHTILHLDQSLGTLVEATHGWSYLLLGLVVFCETGLVVTPFLPGDSLLFGVGALAATGVWNIWSIWTLLIFAAIAGDTVNYMVGSHLGVHIKTTGHFLGMRIKPEHIARTEAFYKTYGAKAIVLARFVPIVRTFAPFVAGMARMEYKTFLLWNIAGGVGWVSLLVGAGYFFGNVPIVKERFGLVVIAIIVLSLLPILKECFAAKKPSTL